VRGVTSLTRARLPIMAAPVHDDLQLTDEQRQTFDNLQRLRHQAGGARVRETAGAGDGGRARALTCLPARARAVARALRAEGTRVARPARRLHRAAGAAADARALAPPAHTHGRRFSRRSVVFAIRRLLAEHEDKFTKLTLIKAQQQSEYDTINAEVNALKAGASVGGE
jgi:hypothetical protein